MNTSNPRNRPNRRRLWSLLGVFAALTCIAGGLLWWLSRPVILPALATPPVPPSPYAAANPTDPPPGGLRLRSEPLLAPLHFNADPLRRKIRAFELVLPAWSAGATNGTIFFDTREITFNAFGDEIFPYDQRAEAHPVHLEEVPRETLASESRTVEIFGREMRLGPRLSETRRLFELVFSQHEHPRQFWFVHDDSPAGDHFLWVTRKPVEIPTNAARALPVTPMHIFPPDGIGLRLFGPLSEAAGPVAQPLRLTGYRAHAGFGMMQMTVEAGKLGEGGSPINRVVTVTPDPNRHDFDVLANPTGMQTLIGHAPVLCMMSPLDLVDPTGQERQVWRLTPDDSVRAGLFRWGGDGSVNKDFHFDLVLAPASNGRHRLLLWQGGQLRDVVHLADALARRRTALIERLQVVPASEREAMRSLHSEDSEADMTIEAGHIKGLSVTRLAPTTAVVQAIHAMPALQSLTLHGGALTAEIAAALTRLQRLTRLTGYSLGIDEGAYELLGRLSKLEALHIRRADRLTDAAAEHLARLTNLTSLVLNREFSPRPDNWRELVLSEQGIAQLTNLTRLTHLDLHGHNASDANCHRLATLTNLTYLALSGERLTDTGLAALKPLTKLRFLHLSDVAITKPAAEAFKRPGLHFEPGPFGRDRD